MVIKLIGQKKGWIKIFEAVIAILILASVLIYITVKNQVQVKNENLVQRISDVQSNILQEISLSSSLRNATINENHIVLEEYIAFNLDKYLNFSFGICNITDLICSPSWPYTSIDTTNEVFVQERIISSTLEIYNPQLLRLYVWKI